MEVPVDNQQVSYTVAPCVFWLKLDASAVVPERKSAGAAGFDLHILDDVSILPGTCVRVRTGLAVSLPQGTVGLIKSRSSSFYSGLDLDGTVDSDYRGEVLLQIRNTTREYKSLKRGERVAQMVVLNLFNGASAEVTALDETARGVAGFGSTGK